MSSHQKDQTTDLQENFTLRMRGLGTRMILHRQNVAAALGLHNSDHISVDILRETGPITAGELSKKTGLSTGSITALIDRLEKVGYVRRENDPNDRRKVLIVPIQKPKEADNQTYLPLHTAMVELAASYTPAELEFITQFLGKADEVLEEQIQHLDARKHGK